MKLSASVVSLTGVLFFVFPANVHAISTLVWGNLVEDPDTGEIFFDNPINMQDGGTYAMPLNVSKDVQIQTDVPSIFPTEGVLFHIPDPEGTREFVASIGGFFGTSTISWEQTGVYELDVYEVDAPVPTMAPWQRVFAYLFGRVAYAQAPENFIETIRFTITEEGAVQECCSSVVFLPGIKGSILKTGSDTLWPPTVWSDDVAQLALNESGESVNDVYVNGILENFSVGPFSTPIYAPFADFLDSIVGEGTISEWLPLPYDWRFSPERIVEDGVKTSSGIEDVITEIEELASQSQTGQVTIVAHSMGGFLGK